MDEARKVNVEGESGLLSVLANDEIVAYNRSAGALELKLVNGAMFNFYSGKEPGKLRGPQHHRAWCDEVVTYQYPGEVLDMLLLGLRLSSDVGPRLIITTTPQPQRWLHEYLRNPPFQVHITRGDIFENAPNLAPSAIQAYRLKYEGTRTGRQELYGEYLEDVEGALWNRSMIEASRLTPAEAMTKARQMVRTVVAVDPAEGTEEGDEVGWAVAAQGLDGHFYVTWSEGTHTSPAETIRRAAYLRSAFNASRIVYEKTGAGEWISEAFRQVAPNEPVKAVHAHVSKRARAEPIAALYEQGRVHHVMRPDRPHVFDAVEDEMVSFTGYGGEPSPNRLDALVYALAELSGSSPPPRTATIYDVPRRDELFAGFEEPLPR
jgi:phage terminase large subunit-like protein